MKKMMVILLLSVLVVIPGIVAAGVDKNPNSFELVMVCPDETIQVTIAVMSAEAGHVDDGRIIISRTHYIDFNLNEEFEDDELVASILRGKGIQTTFCTFTWDRDLFLHGMDLQFVKPK